MGGRVRVHDSAELRLQEAGLVSGGTMDGWRVDGFGLSRLQLQFQAAAVELEERLAPGFAL